MISTFPKIVKYTPAVLEASCKKTGLSKEDYRLGTLKRVDCELGNLLDSALHELHPEDREAIKDLRKQVRLAIADE